MGTGDRVVLGRDEFVRIISERADKPSDVGSTMRYVESCFVLQSDEDRPAYILEVDWEHMDLDSFLQLDEGLRMMKVAAVLVPKKSVAYLGEATARSLGMKAKVDAARKRIADGLRVLAKYWSDEDER